MGHFPVGLAAVVTADNIDLAIQLLELKLQEMRLPQKIDREQLVPLPTHHRYVRILHDGDY